MRISLVIPAYNQRQALSLSLNSLACQRQELHEVIVVDDGSDPPLRVPSWVNLVRIDRDTRHRGSSAAKNLGAKQATGDYLSFCDSDILHMPDAFLSLKRAMEGWESEGESMVLLNTLRGGLPRGFPKERMQNIRLLRDTAGAVLVPPKYDSAICWEQNESLMHRAGFDKIGGYNEALQSWGFNNQDFDMRWVLGGGRVTSAIESVETGKRLICFHIWHGATRNKVKADEEFKAIWGEEFSGDLMRRAIAEAKNGSRVSDADRRTG